MPALDLADAVNETCPWSGKPVQPDSLTLYRGRVVGFCNTGCRDKFDAATRHFDRALAMAEARGPYGDTAGPDDRSSTASA